MQVHVPKWYTNLMVDEHHVFNYIQLYLNGAIQIYSAINILVDDKTHDMKQKLENVKITFSDFCFSYLCVLSSTSMFIAL